MQELADFVLVFVISLFLSSILFKIGDFISLNFSMDASPSVVIANNEEHSAALLKMLEEGHNIDEIRKASFIVKHRNK